MILESDERPWHVLSHRVFVAQGRGGRGEDLGCAEEDGGVLADGGEDGRVGGGVEEEVDDLLIVYVGCEF
jgi:hypothetical protein